MARRTQVSAAEVAAAAYRAVGVIPNLPSSVAPTLALMLLSLKPIRQAIGEPVVTEASLMIAGDALRALFPQGLEHLKPVAAPDSRRKKR